jgi:hypothetical protein
MSNIENVSLHFSGSSITVEHPGDEWIWIRRKSTTSPVGDLDYVISWLIQRKHFSSKDSVPCKKRIWKSGKLEENCSVITKDTLECSEYEAFNYLKPVLNYQIY